MTKETLKELIDKLGGEIFGKQYEMLFSAQFSDNPIARLSLKRKAGIKLESEPKEIKNTGLMVRIFTHAVKRGHSVLEIATIGKEYYNLLQEQNTVLPNIYLVTSDGKSMQKGAKIVGSINFTKSQKVHCLLMLLITQPV